MIRVERSWPEAVKALMRQCSFTYYPNTMNIAFAPRPTSLLGRIVFALFAAVILVLGFFFFAVVLTAGAVLAAVLGARLWWHLRKIKKQAGADVVEGEYRVVEQIEIRPALPPRDKP